MFYILLNYIAALRQNMQLVGQVHLQHVGQLKFLHRNYSSSSKPLTFDNTFTSTMCTENAIQAFRSGEITHFQ